MGSKNMHGPTQIYYWPRSFLLRSRDFVQNKPYQRISTTLIVSLDGDLELETQHGGRLHCAGIVLGPTARRLFLRICNGSAYMIEAEPLSPEHQALMDYLSHQPARSLSSATLQRLRAVLVPHESTDRLSPELARQLHREAVNSIQALPAAACCDARLREAIAQVEHLALDEVSIAVLAGRVGLSESRLRSLSRKTLGCSLSQYVRWLAAWKIAAYWQPDMTLTDAAHAAGFHDLAHANHAFNQMFGMSPTRVVRSPAVVLMPCFEPLALAGV